MWSKTNVSFYFNYFILFYFILFLCSISSRFSCPTYTAGAKDGKSPHVLVQHASSLADPMFQTFRATGVFVGNDAQYMLFEHPDASLRGKCANCLSLLIINLVCMNVCLKIAALHI